MTRDVSLRAEKHSRHRLRFTPFEVLLIAAFVGLAAWYVTDLLANNHPEGRYLFRTYGPQRNSEHHEEWIIRDFFRDRRGGFFLDVGASHYRTYSNTYYLEHSLGWSGIAVEPLVYFAEDYLKHRPATRFRPFFVSDVSDSQAKLYVLTTHPMVSSTDKTFTDRYGNDAKELVVPTITLNDLLDSEGVKRIDFMSMDIELHEPKALAGFDIARFAPALVCIEAHPEVRQDIINYFTSHKYVLVGKYLRADTHNLYFAPFTPELHE